MMVILIMALLLLAHSAATIYDDNINIDILTALGDYILEA